MKEINCKNYLGLIIVTVTLIVVIISIPLVFVFTPLRENITGESVVSVIVFFEVPFIAMLVIHWIRYYMNNQYPGILEFYKINDRFLDKSFFILLVAVMLTFFLAFDLFGSKIIWLILSEILVYWIYKEVSLFKLYKENQNGSR